jgi:Tol biopolymer transport system component
VETLVKKTILNHIRNIISTLFALLVLCGCGNVESKTAPVSTSVPSNAIPQLSVPYLGQKTPGMEPEIFAPGIVSDPNFNEFSGTSSPDGSKYYFYRFSENTQPRLLFSKVMDGKWSTPEGLAFTGEYGASEPHLTLDNKKLYFMWRHPVPEGQPDLPSYYFVERTPNGWSEPKYAGQRMFLSSSRDGDFYTTDLSLYNYRTTYLAKVTVVDGVITNYEKLSIQPRLGRQAHPCIAPDGSYLLFDVESGNHLFVSFKNPDGTWGEAIDLTKHGFDPLAGGATISPDGKYLFFSLRSDIWWVDIKVIENLMPQEQE